MIKKIFNLKFPISNFAKRAGFTILESIVAIFILSLAISGAFVAVGQGLLQSSMAKDDIKAYYLAQEAFEIIRNKRDSNQLLKINTGNGFWLTGIAQFGSDPCYFGRICSADASVQALVYCGTNWGSCGNLRQNQTTFIYGYNPSWKDSGFKREIKIEEVNWEKDSLGNDALSEISITVRITWSRGLLTRTFEAKSNLLNRI